MSDGDDAEDNSAAGCLIVGGAFAVAVATWCFVGAGWGFLMLGIMALFAGVLRARR